MKQKKGENLNKPKEEKMGILLPKYKCNQCGHEWIPRSEDSPRMCPRCKSVRWDKQISQQTKNEK